MTYAHYLDFYQRGPYASCLREQRTAGSAPIHLLEADQPAGEYPDAATPDLMLGVLRWGTATHDLDLGAGRWRGRCKPGAMALAPAGVATHFAQDGPTGFLFTAVPFATVKDILAEACPTFTDFGPLHARPFYDPGAAALCARLWDEAVEDNPHGRLFADGAIVALLAILLRVATKQPLAADRAKGGLTPVQLQRVIELVRARLDGELTLAILASAAGLSSFHFSRAFKLSTGESPHAFVLRTRVEHAQLLLQSTRIPITEVALACGFADAQHLAKLFRLKLGTTPTAYRRSAGT